ncbi:alpha/beta hydrolase [Flavobacterium jejuense]|uniref:Alpha/beta hydrolase n=1 Tax=Flavobacterium jejuense TaxID=1544455 RepID=A0ABX0ISN5_9FLAO|nr:alpha/beta hydrolase [Flavobacterium jejuense]NHN25819.1 alpha/beta hydrolase [Flavobacterium jejuense]
MISISCVYSQVNRNLSYNTSSEYKKQLKKFPFIKITNSVKDSLVQETSDVIYFKNEKISLHLDAYLYKSYLKLPTILLIHGGGWASGNKSMLGPLAQNIAKKGYNCFSIQYRLSEEAQYPASINDILDALEFIKTNASKFNVDILKIGVLGCSSGAQMASLLGTKYPEKFQAIINLDGVLAFHHPESSEGSYAAKWLGGTYEEKPEIWEEASALSHVSKKTPPILFINSQYDRFHAGRDDMIKILNENKIYNRVEEIKDSPHTFWLFEPWFDDTVSYITRFLDQQFKLN